MRVLLFQARDEGDPMRAHEEDCFRDKLSRYPQPIDLVPFNLVTEPPPEQASWREFDLVFVGGSGHYGCVDNVHPWYVQFLATLGQVARSSTPMFCSCFGHQALAVALGGQVITDRANAELGTHWVELTEHGQKDPLFDRVPSPFAAQFGHNDRVVTLPPGTVHLAATAVCPIQSYRLADRLIYATQFHPEMDHLENRQRANGYLQVYDVEKTRDEALAEMFRPSPWASQLLGRFLDLVAQRPG